MAFGHFQGFLARSPHQWGNWVPKYQLSSAMEHTPNMRQVRISVTLTKKKKKRPPSLSHRCMYIGADRFAIGLPFGCQLISPNCYEISAYSRSISQWPPFASRHPVTSGRWHILRYWYNTHTLVPLAIVVSDYFDKSGWAEIGKTGPMEPPITIQWLRHFISGRWFKIVIQRNRLSSTFSWQLLINSGVGL